LWIFRSLPDAGYPLARILGWIVATYFVFVAVNLGLGSFSWPACALGVVAVALCSWLPHGPRSALRHLPPRRLLIACELLFLTTFALFLIVRAYNPEIFWGEKTMDFSLYNGVMRSGVFPPHEPWFSGVSLNYYYYGYVLVGFLTHLTGTPTALGFNLAMAAIPALTLTAAFSLAYNLSRKLVWGFVGAGLVGLVGNLDPLFQLLRQAYHSTRPGWASWLELPLALWREPAAPSMWDSFWATSRALGPGMINEYPLWTWLFADLHAHVMVMPVSLLLLSMVYTLFRIAWEPSNRERGRAAVVAALAALVLGTQLATNAWDFLAYVGLLVLVLTVVALLGRDSTDEAGSRLFPPFREGRGANDGAPSLAPAPVVAFVFVVLWTLAWPLVDRLHPYWLGLFSGRGIGLLLALGIVAMSWRHEELLRITERLAAATWRVLRRALLPTAVVVVGGILLYYWFHAGLDTGHSTLRLNRDGNIGVANVVRHFGLFLLATLLWVGASLGRGESEAGQPWWRRRLAALAAVEAALVLFLVSTGRWESAGGLSVYLLLLPAVFFALISRRNDAEHVFSGLLLLGGWGLATVSELVVLIDRMNTVFKLYHPAWIFLALGSATALAGVWERQRWSVRRGTPMRRVAAACVGVVLGAALLVTLACTWRGVQGVLTHDRKAGARPTIDGLDFLRHTPEDRELLEAVTWLNRNVTGVAVVAEAFTDRGYDESARVSKYTGLPIVLGWPHHIKQRGRTPEELRRRSRDLERLYGSGNATEVLSICRRYGIRYIFVGELEARQHDDPARRMSDMQGLREVFRGATGRIVIYEVDDPGPEAT
jgi:YYY domain-containing protein